MLFFLALLVIAATFSSKLSSRFGIPVLLLFLAIGMIAGSDVLNLIYFDNAVLSQKIANIALIFILFESGFKTKKSILKTSLGPSVILATFGVIATAAALGVLIHLILKYDLVYSFLISSIISSTDAAAVIGILRQKTVRTNVSSTLEAESALNDPMAILLTLTAIDILLGETSNVLMLSLKLLWQLCGGFLVGWVFSKISVFLFNRLNSESRAYYDVLTIGIILLSYGFADLVRANGIIAVFFTGFWIGNGEFIYKKGMERFTEGLSTVANVGIFLLLGLLVFPREFKNVWKEGLLISGLLIFAVRPLTVLASTAFFKFTFGERLFLMWGGIKGAVPIVLATYPAVYGLDNGVIFNVVFFAVLISCLLQGTTMGWIAEKLRLTVPSQPRSLISLELMTVKQTDIDMFEIRIGGTSGARGKMIKDLHLPEDILISSIVRNNRIVPPKGKTVVLENDILYVLVPAARLEEVNRVLNDPRGETDAQPSPQDL